MSHVLRHAGEATTTGAGADVVPVAQAIATAPASGIYEGWVRHRRFAPRVHAFRYRIAMLYIDLDEADALFRGRWLWSRDRRNLAEFRRSDFLGDPSVPLATAVRDRVASATGRRPSGAVRMLAHLRYGGHIFNPVAFYYCHDARGALQAVVAEITNTPWKERHAYVLDVDAARHRGRALAWRFDKAFHVSPFMAMERRYVWAFTEPGDGLQVHMDVLSETGREFDASLVLRRRPWSGAALARVLWRYPLMTLRVVWGIHWQALRLWLKRVPVHDHPHKRARTTHPRGHAARSSPMHRQGRSGDAP